MDPCNQEKNEKISDKKNPDGGDPTKCLPCGTSNFPVCGSNIPNLTCRPAGRPWGRACGPVTFNGKCWKEARNKKNCQPAKIRGKCSKNRLPYGFGVYARKLYPLGLPCVGNYSLPQPACNKTLYPLLPTKPVKIYSTYTFNQRGPPYTCPRPCISSTQ